MLCPQPKLMPKPVSCSSWVYSFCLFCTVLIVFPHLSADLLLFNLCHLGLCLKKSNFPWVSRSRWVTQVIRVKKGRRKPHVFIKQWRGGSASKSACCSSRSLSQACISGGSHPSLVPASTHPVSQASMGIGTHKHTPTYRYTLAHNSQ